MKTGIITGFLFLACLLCAQDKGIATIPPSDAILEYLAGTKEYSILYSGKLEIPYDLRYENHPYLETDKFVQGTLCYNNVVYQDVFMRLDLFRDELIVYFPDNINRVVLEKEKFNYAILNGYSIITSTNETKQGTTYVLQLKDGTFPIIKNYRIRNIEKNSNNGVKRSFYIQEQYFVYINDTAHLVRNKNALLKLFPDRKKDRKSTRLNSSH